MKQTKLSEYLKVYEPSDLFTDVAEYSATLAEFPTEALEDMNAMLSVDYGERIVYENFTYVSTDIVVRVLARRFNDSWERLVFVHDDEQNDTGKLTVETITDEELGSRTSADINKVSGYDSPTMVDDTGTDRTESDSRDSERVRELKESNSSIRSTIYKYNQLTRHKLYATIVSDVAHYLSLSIYRG